MWLRGEGEPSLRSQKPLRLTGVLRVAPDRIALDDVDADIDGSAVTGRIALSDVVAPAAGAPRDGLRLEAAVTGERLDLDGLIGLARGFADRATIGPTKPPSRSISAMAVSAAWTSRRSSPMRVTVRDRRR